MKQLIWTIIGLILLAAAIILLNSCSKNGYKPDADQVSCEMCLSMKIYYEDQDLTKQIGLPDTAFYGLLCDKNRDVNFHLSDFKNSVCDTVGKVCNSSGELIHYERVINKIVKN